MYRIIYKDKIIGYCEDVKVKNKSLISFKLLDLDRDVNLSNIEFNISDAGPLCGKTFIGCKILSFSRDIKNLFEASTKCILMH